MQTHTCMSWEGVDHCESPLGKLILLMNIHYTFIHCVNSQYVLKLSDVLIALHTIIIVTWCHRLIVTFATLLALCEGNSLVIGRFHPKTWSFDGFFNVSLNKIFDKQWSCRWFYMPWGSYDVTYDSIATTSLALSPCCTFWMACFSKIKKM